MIRTERPGDVEQVYAVHCGAFPTAAEAELVDQLRANDHAVVSLVAEEEMFPSRIVGHVCFSPVSIHSPAIDKDAGIRFSRAAGHLDSPAAAGESEPATPLFGLGLAPVAVLPSHQGKGFGSRLINAGLDACRELNVDFVVVLGEPSYYQKFGFQTASAFDLQNEYGVDQQFMLIELTTGRLANVEGLVRYGVEFRVES